MSAEVKQVNLNIDELKGFLVHIVENNRFLQSQGKTSAAVEIQGESGIGKTSAVLQLASGLELDVVKLNLAQIEDLGDLVGFPVRQFQLQKKKPIYKITKVPTKGKDGEAEIKEVKAITGFTIEDTQWVDEQATQEYIKRGYEFTDKKRMSYCPPEWIADKKRGGILILDDWNRADMRFIQAVMELVDRQEYISWKMPKDWHIILTANPDDGKYLVQSIDAAQRTRFISINLKFEASVWAEWAETAGIDSRCINFLLLHPELVVDSVNPRSITTFFNAISSIADFEKALPLIQMIGEGSVGVTFTTMFTTFINNKLDKLVSPRDMLLHENEAYIIGETRSCIGRGDDYRADIASVLTTRLINFTTNYAESNTITDEHRKRIIKYATDEDTLTDDLKYHLVKKILNAHKQKFQLLMTVPEIVEMSMK